jgi:hypothetical protein
MGGVKNTDYPDQTENLSAYFSQQDKSCTSSFLI